jgi:hypothetical protein
VQGAGESRGVAEATQGDADVCPAQPMQDLIRWSFFRTPSHVSSEAQEKEGQMYRTSDSGALSDCGMAHGEAANVAKEAEVRISHVRLSSLPQRYDETRRVIVHSEVSIRTDRSVVAFEVQDEIHLDEARDNGRDRDMSTGDWSKRTMHRPLATRANRSQLVDPAPTVLLLSIH